MKRIKAVYTIALIALFAFLITMVIYYDWKIVFVKKYDVTLTIGDRIGFDLGSEVISFGTVLPGSELSRSLELANSLGIPLKVVIKQYGDTAQFVSIDKNIFLVEPHETEHIAFLAKIPNNAVYGNYTGKMVIRGLRT